MIMSFSFCKYNMGFCDMKSLCSARGVCQGRDFSYTIKFFLITIMLILIVQICIKCIAVAKLVTRLTPS